MNMPHIACKFLKIMLGILLYEWMYGEEDFYQKQLQKIRGF